MRKSRWCGFVCKMIARYLATSLSWLSKSLKLEKITNMNLFHINKQPETLFHNGSDCPKFSNNVGICSSL